MKHLLVLLAITSSALLAGCEAGYKTENFSVLPPELKDCKFYYLMDSRGVSIHVVRCPNSTTSTDTGGKGPTRTITVDGVEYIEKK